MGRRREALEPDFASLIAELEAAHQRRDRLSRGSYDDQYPALLTAVAVFVDSEDAHDLVAAAHIAYGWMPTAIERCDTKGWGVPKAQVLGAIRACDNADTAIEFVNGIGDQAPISGGNKTNASWVGTSKLLHFVKPEVFPVWDENVAWHYGCTADGARRLRTEYERYLRHLHENRPVHGVRARRLVECIVGYTVSEVRALEKVLFLTAET